MCTNGHVFAWLIDAVLAPKYCSKCGDPVLVACPVCNAVLPADGEMLQWVPYHENCWQCGKAYPWKAANIARAKRTLAEQAQVEQWSEAAKARADELVDDIAADRTAASGVLAALDWLAQDGAESATPTILHAIERLATTALKTALRARFPGSF